MLIVITPLLVLVLYRAVTDGSLQRAVNYIRANKFITLLAMLLLAISVVIAIAIAPAVYSVTNAIIGAAAPIVGFCLVCKVLNAIIPERVRGCACGRCATEQRKYECRVARAEHAANNAVGGEIVPAYEYLSRVRSWHD
jgi:hypothetical protein